jgi:type IV pilus assembly protein PilO
MDTKNFKATFDSFLDTKVIPLAPKHKAAISVGVLIIPVALFYFLYFSPKGLEISALEASVTKQKTELAEVKAKAAKLGEQKALMAAVEEKFKEAALVIPDTKEIPSLLSSISSQGSGAGLDIISFVPGTGVDKEFYSEIPVALSVTGTYHNVGYFLDTVSKLPRIVNVAKVSMGAPKLTEGEMLIDAKLELLTYKFIEPPDAATAKDAKK